MKRYCHPEALDGDSLRGESNLSEVSLREPQTDRFGIFTQALNLMAIQYCKNIRR